MDALGGYGSEGDSSDNSPDVTGPSGLTGLLGDVSDASSEDESTHRQAPPPKKIKTTSNPDNVPQGPRPFTWDDLPKPPLNTKDDDQASMSRWAVNYLQPNQENGEPCTLETSTAVEALHQRLQEHWEKLQQANQANDSKWNCWGDYIRSQQDFYNPHATQALMDQFQISHTFVQPHQDKLPQTKELRDFEAKLAPPPLETHTDP